MKSFSVHYFAFLVSIFLTSCAIQVPPAGGDQDTSAPKVLESVPENSSTNFTGHEISIRFDEFIQLKDAQTQLVISPPLNQFPELKLRKKNLFIHFEDTLEQNTTYSFNFGNSIVDNNEGNPIENFQFVFSTGDVIDSLEVTGSIHDAFDAKPEKDALVMLYKQDIDSLPFIKRPYYFGKSDEKGDYRIRNIRPGSYKIIGLADLNKNYLYNSYEEGIAFSESMVESGQVNVNLNLFKETEGFKMMRAYSEEPGKSICAFNGRADTLTIIWISDTTLLDIHSINYSEKKDSLTIWYKNILSDTIQLVLPQLSSDTITIRLLKGDSKVFSRSKPQLRISAGAGALQYQELNRDFELVFNHPVKKAELNRVKILEDSADVSQESFRFSDSLHTRLRYQAKWKPEATYNLFIPSGVFTDIFGLENDTLISVFKTRQESDYASLTSIISSGKESYPVLLQLVDEKDNIYKEVVIQKDSTIEFGFLMPGMYRLKIIFDSNSNGRWDTGSYLSKRQPELVKYYPDPIQIRSNWDVEIKWQLP